MHIEVFPSEEKHQQIADLLKFDTVMVFIDARHPDIQVPEQHKNQFDLRLNFDYEFGIEDFRVLPDRLEATLSFEEGDFFCVIPFAAVYLMVCHAVSRGSLFPQSVPVEMLDFFFDGKSQDLPKAARRPFKVIPNQPEETEKPAKKRKSKKNKESKNDEILEDHAKLPKKNHLRLVKS